VAAAGTGAVPDQTGETGGAEGQFVVCPLILA
jgi:hypothetical protein